MHSSGHKLTYRPEIDGMRCIAVTAVLIYHLKITVAGISILPGGFLGVDLFFVLSGFLITKILLEELQTQGRIGFGRFYARRARRILPPLLLVMLVSVPVALAVLLPSELSRFGMSLLTNLFFVSNIFWADQLGSYGAQSSLLQPFLHTWSLAIEEQFYLLFPLVLIGLFKIGARNAIWIGIVALALISLVIAHMTTLHRPDLSFFSPLSRAWELLAGSGLAYLSQKRPDALRTGRFAGFVPVFSLLVIVGYFVAFHFGQHTHPGLPTLPFILACCGLLWFTQPGEPVTKVLSTSPFVFIGKLSYSIYLWHFPVFAFGRLTNLDGVTAADHALWIVVTLALSAAGYYAIEKPFRFRIPGRAFVATTFMATLAIAIFAGLSSFTDVLSQHRLAKLDALYQGNIYDNEVLQKQSWSILKDLNPDSKEGEPEAHVASRHEKEDRWFKDAGGPKILVVGNSHGKDFFNGLHLNADGYEVARYGLRSSFAKSDVDALFASPNFAAADIVMVATKYDSTKMANLSAALQGMRAREKRVLLIGNTAEFESPGVLPIFDWYLRRSGDHASLEKLNALAPRYEVASVAPLNLTLRDIAEQLDIRFVSRRDLVCDDAVGSCRLMTPDGKKAMFDGHHWTLDGARYFVRRALEQGLLE